MSIQPEKVRLELTCMFPPDHMARIKEAARRMGNDLARDQATWEPHDWTEWP